MNNFEYFPINWVEGMHINASHFINTENFLLEELSKLLLSPSLGNMVFCLIATFLTQILK